MPRKFAIIYGSGASYGSGFKLKFKDDAGKELFCLPPPMDRGFFKHDGVRAVYEQGQFFALKLFIDKYLRGDKNLSLEEVWSSLDINFKQSILGTYDWQEENERYITKCVNDRQNTYPFSDMIGTLQYLNSQGEFTISNIPVYNSYKFLGDCGRDLRTLVALSLGQISNSNFLDSNYAKLHEIVRSLGIPPAYITFNYDLLLETALQKLGWKPHYLAVNETYDLVSPEKLWPHRALVLKLHGSLGWLHKSGGQDIMFSVEPILPTYLNKGLVGYYSEPAIVPPTFTKLEINDDTRARDPLTRALITQWKAAISILENSDRIIIVGYSFPHSDFHASRLFRIARMRRKSEVAQKILVSCAEPEGTERDELRKRISQQLGFDEEHIEVRGLFADLVSDSEDVRNFLAH